jgi:hypothetical protein
MPASVGAAVVILLDTAVLPVVRRAVEAQQQAALAR